MKSRLLCSVAGLAAVATSPAWSQSTEPVELDEVVVTATRLPAIVAETPGARVIDARTIQQRGAVFAADILSDVPGLSVVRTGAFGGLAQVRMRGAAPGKTLVLIDGVPVNDPAEIGGAFDFSGLELGDVERIEILSGPQSSLWGSDAIGGVIAFQTRELDGLSAEAEAGSFATLRGRLAAGVSTERYGVGVYGSRFVTDGISAADQADGNPERDGYRNTTLGAKGRVSLGSGVILDGAVRHTDAQVDIDGFPPPAFDLADTFDRAESEQWSGFGRLRLSALSLDHAFSVSASDLERVTVSAFPSTFQGDRQLYRWQADGRAAGVAFAFGAEREDTRADLSSGLSRALGTTSVFALAQGSPIERLSLTGAVRFDDTDDFGSETTGRVSAAWSLTDTLILSGAYSTGFKAPSVSQAVCDFCFAPPPFPDLRPETAEGIEAAIGWRDPAGRLQARATVYRLDVRDQISFVSGRYVNIARTRTDGVELEARAVLPNGFDLTAAYGWTDAQDRDNGLRLQRVPEHAGSVTLGWSGERLAGAVTVRAEGDQDDVDNATFSRAVREGFVTTNLNAAYRLNDAVSLTARIENLADTHYQQVLGYGEPGRSAYLGLRLRY